MKKRILSLACAFALIAGSLITPAPAMAQTRPIVEQRQSKLSIGSQPMTESSANYLRQIKYLTVAPQDQSSASFHGNDPGAIRRLENPLRRQIFEAMSRNSESFSFATLADAQDNFTMRLTAIDFMTRMGQGQASGVDFDYLGKSVPAAADPRYWINTKGHRFRTLDGVRAAEAIDGIVQSRFRGECLGAIHVTVLHAARQAIGADRFNELHPNGLNIPGSSVDKHWRSGSLDPRNMVPGDRVYIQNKDDYRAAADAGGYWSGENALYMGRVNGQQRFSGMGLYNKTEAELRQALKSHYLADMQRHQPGVQHRIDDADVRWTTVSRLETGSRATTSLVRPGPVTESKLANTTWVGSETLPGYGRLEFRFHADGKVLMIDARSRAMGSYSQGGNSVTLTFGSAVYSGTMTDGSLAGPARSGQNRWTFTVTR